MGPKPLGSSQSRRSSFAYWFLIDSIYGASKIEEGEQRRAECSAEDGEMGSIDVKNNFFGAEGAEKQKCGAEGAAKIVGILWEIIEILSEVIEIIEILLEIIEN